jgi:hypothetical protein
MEIYTYYDPIDEDDSEQLELIDFWIKSWEKNEYDAIVLKRKDAESHPFFKDFNDHIIRIHKKMMAGSKSPEDIQPYGLSCYHRWLAYANQTTTEPFFVSDYDVYNTGFEGCKLIDNLHMMHNVCPCFSSGTPIQFLDLCVDFIRISDHYYDNISSTVREFIWYHDQNFFIANKEFLDSEKIKFSNLPDWNNSLHHVSHQYVYDKFKVYDNVHANRIKIIKNLLK